MRHYTLPLLEENFDDIHSALKPTMIFICRNNIDRFNDLEADDLFQIFSIKLWDMIKLKKYPSDMLYCDFRFRRYCQIAFMNELADVAKKKINRYQKKRYGLLVFHDAADNSTAMSHLDMEF